MSPLPPEVLAEKAAAIERHLRRVESRLPPAPGVLAPGTDASDVVILHLWQAVQIAIDLALSTVVRAGQPTPATYADAFRTLAQMDVIAAELANRLARAAGFRNRLVHAYEGLDLAWVTDAARHGPADLRALVACLQRFAALVHE